MLRQEIRSFVSRYVDINGEAVEALTEYRHFNKQLVEKDREEIFSFFKKIYNFSKSMSFKDLKESKYNETIYELKYLYDLDEFEDLIGLLFMSGIIKDDLIRRTEIVGFLGNKTRYLIRDLEFDTKVSEEDYVEYLDLYIIPVHRFNVNPKFKQESLLKNKNIELRAILNYWFSKKPETNVMKSVFNEMLETRLDDILNYAVTMNILGIEGQMSLVLNILGNTVNNLLDEMANKERYLTTEQAANFDEYKEKFINDLKEEMQNKNKRSR